jgi:hypothetical protein
MADSDTDVSKRPEPIEVDVERLPLDGEQSPSGRSAAKRAEVGKLVGPVVAGVVIDVIDLATPVPLVGFALGWPIGAYIARQAGADSGLAVKLGFLVGIYCAVPMTAGLPIGTMIGTAVKLRQALN